MQKVLQNYRSLQETTEIIGMDELFREDKLTAARASKIQIFLSQTFQIDKEIL